MTTLPKTQLDHSD